MKFIGKNKIDEKRNNEANPESTRDREKRLSKTF